MRAAPPPRAPPSRGPLRPLRTRRTCPGGTPRRAAPAQCLASRGARQQAGRAAAAEEAVRRRSARRGDVRRARWTARAPARPLRFGRSKPASARDPARAPQSAGPPECRCPAQLAAPRSAEAPARWRARLPRPPAGAQRSRRLLLLLPSPGRPAPERPPPRLSCARSAPRWPQFPERAPARRPPWLILPRGGATRSCRRTLRAPTAHQRSGEPTRRRRHRRRVARGFRTPAASPSSLA